MNSPVFTSSFVILGEAKNPGSPKNLQALSEAKDRAPMIDVSARPPSLIGGLDSSPADSASE
jgi:hypothetical protein